jgi:hypothetical protein
MDGNIQKFLYQKFVFGDGSGMPLAHSPLMAENNRCTAEKKVLTFGQAMTHYIASIMAKADNRSRGLMVWHSTGSGKSCTAVAIVDAFLASSRPIYYVTTAALQRKTENDLLSCAVDLFTDAMFKKKRLAVTTYAILAHMIKNGKIEKNAVIILDEVHNLYYPLPTQREEHAQLINCLVHDSPNLSDAKIFIMTATPGSNTSQVMKLLNIIRDRRRPELVAPDLRDVASMDKFTRSIIGMITYLDMSHDASLFPKVVERDPRFAKMGEAQMEYYLQKLRDTDDVEADYASLLKQKKVGWYWLKARKASNSVYNRAPEMQMAEFSAKLPLLLQTIVANPDEKHYVYSAFYERHGFGGHGVHMIAHYLTELGYEEMTVANASRDLPPKKRFMVLTSSTLGGSKSVRAEKLNAKRLLNTFNSSKNARGELAHVVLASQGYNEGIDLKAIRHVHLFEPLVEFSMEVQTIGRAARYCSHSQLRKENGEWTVNVHRYLTESPDDLALNLIDGASPEIDEANAQQELMVEKIVYREARERIKDMRLIELCMKRAAIDCMLTNSFHGTATECIQDDASI